MENRQEDKEKKKKIVICLIRSSEKGEANGVLSAVDALGAGLELLERLQRNAENENNNKNNKKGEN